MRRISVSKSPTTVPSACAMSSTKTHPPNAAARCRPDAVVDLIKRLVTVSMRTQELLETLPKLEIPEVQG